MEQVYSPPIPKMQEILCTEQYPCIHTDLPVCVEDESFYDEDVSELLNAGSMLFTFAVALLFVDTPCARWACIAGFLVVPSSIALHAGKYMGRIRTTLDTDIRRMDQTMQLISTPLLAWALSQNISFSLFVACLAVYPVWTVWDEETTNDCKRWLPIAAVASFSVLMPMIYHQQWTYMGAAAVTALCGALVFSLREKKNMHTIFHLLVAVWAAIVCMAAQEQCSQPC
eukprot:68813-Rhodomonas_salina.1